MRRQERNSTDDMTGDERRERRKRAPKKQKTKLPESHVEKNRLIAEYVEKNQRMAEELFKCRRPRYRRISKPVLASPRRTVQVQRTKRPSRARRIRRKNTPKRAKTPPRLETKDDNPPRRLETKDDEPPATSRPTRDPLAEFDSDGSDSDDESALLDAAGAIFAGAAAIGNAAVGLFTGGRRPRRSRTPPRKKKVKSRRPSTPPSMVQKLPDLADLGLTGPQGSFTGDLATEARRQMDNTNLESKSQFESPRLPAGNSAPPVPWRGSRNMLGDLPQRKSLQENTRRTPEGFIKTLRNVLAGAGGSSSDSSEFSSSEEEGDYITDMDEYEDAKLQAFLKLRENFSQLRF